MRLTYYRTSKEHMRTDLCSKAQEDLQVTSYICDGGGGREEKEQVETKT